MTPTVASTMSDPVLGVRADTSLRVALTTMARARVRHLPVIAGDRCLGLLTESDALWHTWAVGSAEDAVSRVMRAPAPAVDVGVPFADAAKAVDESGVDGVVVTDGGALVGMLTSADIVRAVAR
ncbi:HPP family protein [Actinokineospora soli]|uniref:HPP family protein n=1 Tax=Actinokineospora soli TaxID=1048753 RepID=A0ABW2TSA6_9PSEU